MQITSTIQTSNKVSNLFTDYVSETYPNFIEFVEAYYQSQEDTFGSLDILNNLLSYFNIRNEKLNNLKESTALIDDGNNSIHVLSTKGFVNSGFLKIDDEYIYYKSKNKNTFLGCVRGVSTSEIVDDNFVYKSSIYKHHTNTNVTTNVINVAYSFSNYILNQFKYVYLQNLPTKLNPNINYGILISNIKDFYASKGTEASIKFLFNILYDDTTIKLKLKPRGSGAIIHVIVVAGIITNAVVINGGSGYSNDIQYYPIIELIGIGKDAQIKVTNVVNGIITAVSVVNGGEFYTNNNNIFVTEKNFTVDSTLYGSSSSAVGIVDYWNPDTLELYLRQVDGVFLKNELLYNAAYGIIDKIEVIFPEVGISLPYENTLKTYSNDTNLFSQILLELDGDIDSFKLLSGNQNLILYQHYTAHSNIKSLDLSILEFNTISSDNNKPSILATIEKTDLLYLPPYTSVISTATDSILVDSTIGFSNSGILKIGTEYISYTSKSIDEFIGIVRNINYNDGISYNIVTGDRVLAYGGYNNGQIFDFNVKINDCKFRLIGVASQPKIIDGASGYRTSIVNKLIGTTSINPLNYTWENTVRVYNSGDYTYIASSGIPISTSNTSSFNKQKLLKRYLTNNIVQSTPTAKGIGLMNNGVEINNYKGEVINYGKINKITIVDFGNNYYLPNKINDIYPYITINNVEYQGLIKIYGGAKKITLNNIPKPSLENYNKKPEISIVRGIGDVTGTGLELECDYDVSGVLNGITVVNSGKWYTEIPTITIINGGKYIAPLIIPKENIFISGFIGRSNFTQEQLNDINFDPQLYKNLDIPNSVVYNDIPNVSIPNGIGATFSIDTVLGVVTSATVINGGKNYFTTPTLIVKNSDGTGVNFLVNTLFGKIVYVEIINGGIGYSKSPILVVDDSKNTAAIFNCVIDTWTKNIVFNNQNIDNTGGYVYNLSDFNLSIENISDYDNYPQYLQLLYTNTNTNIHSPIIGWAYDGCPIYGSYGYSNPLDKISNIVLLTNNWIINTNTLLNRPNIINGAFVEDYIYVGEFLDEHNGRFCITPDFPSGKYCYFASNTFPYFVGNNFKYKFDAYNHKKINNNSIIPQNSIRVFKDKSDYLFPKNDKISYIANVSGLSTGTITGYNIEFSGYRYEVGDIILFDDDNGSAIVSKVNTDGGIINIDLIDIGFNLSEIPKHTINSKDGFGALLIFVSNDIGKIKTIKQISNGCDFNGDPTINYKLDTDLVLDLVYNNTITGFKILSGGNGFNNEPIILNNDFTCKFSIFNGSIIKCEVVEGGTYHEVIPTLNIIGGNNNAIIIPIIKKSQINDTTTLYYGLSRNNFVGSAKITYYDKPASTLQIKVLSGTFENISDILYLWDDLGNKIGKISNIRNADISCSSSSCSYITEESNTDSYIVPNNVLIDNQKYQQHSYTISSGHPIEEWKSPVVDNVHMLGNKLTSIYKIDKVVKLYTSRQKQIYNLVDYNVDVQSVLKSIIKNIELLKLQINIDSFPEDLTKNTQFSKHYFDYMYYDNNYVYSNYRQFTNYNVGDLVWLSEQYNRIILKVISPQKILTTDYTTIKFKDLVCGSNKNSILEYNGVIQHPKYNYQVTNNLVKLYNRVVDIDRIVLFNLYSTNLIFTDINPVQNVNFSELFVNQNVYIPIDSNKLIVFVNNVVNSSYTLLNNRVTFDQTINGDVYAIYSDDIDKLNLVPLTSTTYNITNFTITNQSLLVFVNGVIQHPENYTITNNKLIINSTDSINYVCAWVSNNLINVDADYMIIKPVAPKVVPAIFEYIFSGGILVDLIIDYAGLNYPRYLRLQLIGGNNDALVLLETLNGSVIRYKILSGGSGYNINPIPKIYGFGNIQTQRYPIILDESETRTLLPNTYIPIVLFITATPNILEVGSSLYAISLNWTLSKSPNTSVSITDVPIVDIFALSGSTTVNYTTPVASSKTYTITTMDYGHINTSSTQVQFLFRNYWSKTNKTFLSNSDVLSQSNSVLSDTKNGSYSFTNLSNEYIYVAYPVFHGLPTFTFETFVVTFEQQYITSFTNAVGGVTDYYIYRSDNMLNGSVTVTIS